MACRVLFFDLNIHEQKFFDNYSPGNFDIQFFRSSLNNQTVNDLSEYDLDKTAIICLSIASKIDKEILDKFKNLRMISTRSLEYSHIDLTECINRNIAVVNVDPFNEPDFVENIMKIVLSSMDDYVCGGKKCRVV